jgi:hypothetical protein
MPTDMATRLVDCMPRALGLSASVEAEIAQMDPADHPAFLRECRHGWR